MQHRPHPAHLRQSLLVLALAGIFAPAGAWALELMQGPAGNKEPVVRPNVIVSIDDSGSMDYRLDSETTSGANSTLVPNADGSWPRESQRINVLKYALRSIFDPTHPNYKSDLIPNGSIRMAWQAMNNRKKSGSQFVDYPSPSMEYDAGSVDSDNDAAQPAQEKVNSMHVLDALHRSNFLAFIDRLTPDGSTPSPKMFKQADAYMRRALGPNGPWAAKPGTTGAPYLGCRRNYHIFMTDGRWNQTVTETPPLTDANSVDKLLPDGTRYGAAAQELRPAGTQLYTDNTNNTLADWSFSGWAQPLQTSGLTGAPVPQADYLGAPASETFGNDDTGAPATLAKYWNPKYNPATWPHMVTYTIGFSEQAYQWTYQPALPLRPITPPSQMVPFGWDGAIPNLITGQSKWPALSAGTEARNALDLWHAALNSRGRFYAVQQGQDLERAFRDIFTKIKTEAQPGLSSSATSGSNISSSPVGRYTSGYAPEQNWSGTVSADTIKSTGVIEPAPGWSGQSTANQLDAPGFNVGARLVLSWNDKLNAAGKENGGVAFEWASDESRLSNRQKTWLQRNGAGDDEGAALGQARLNYVRGERSMEGTAPSNYTSAKPFRERSSRQGDIVHSQLWYSGAPTENYAIAGYADFLTKNKNRTPMLYVGGNDGMLHGFSAADGSEKLAYVPKGVIPTLRYLSETDYNDKHLAFVDGSPMTGDILDASLSTPRWSTLLVGTLGAGGTGYFVLDVTNPGGGDGASGPAFSAANAGALVLLDRTRSTRESAPDCVTALSAPQQLACAQDWSEAADIGHITAAVTRDGTNPQRSNQIARLSNGRWAAVLGNGYNSRNQRPVLLVQYLDGDKKLLRIPATSDAPGSGLASDNGLAAPRLVDVNDDGRVDVAYAGDSLGNLWKFDLTHRDDARWAVAFGGAPLFSARGPATLGATTRDQVQPISAAPLVRANTRMKTVSVGGVTQSVAVGGLMVAFGTGRNVATSDAENLKVQTLYSVLDNTRYAYDSDDSTCSGTPKPCVSVASATALGTGVSAARLMVQTLSEQDSGAWGSINVSADADASLNASTWATHNGWYLDLPASGERVLQPLQFYDASNLLAVYSTIPARGASVEASEESCASTAVAAERQYLTLINIQDGRAPLTQLVDYNGDGRYNADDARVSRMLIGRGPHSLVTDKRSILDIDSKGEKKTLARQPEMGLRPSWRQLR